MQRLLGSSSALLHAPKRGRAGISRRGPNHTERTRPVYTLCRDRQAGYGGGAARPRPPAPPGGRAPPPPPPAAPPHPPPPPGRPPPPPPAAGPAAPSPPRA